MLLLHYRLPDAGACWGVAASPGGPVCRLAEAAGCGDAFLAALLQWPDPAAVLRSALRPGTDPSLAELSAASVGSSGPHLLAPIDRQEVWAAGVTYLRSKVARMAESEGAARFYDLVYDADRPELFFKGMASRVSGAGAPIRIRTDATWNVPEPELALLLSPSLRLVGYTLCNDVSSRDIEGENPLYLPQAKVYRQACGLGPVILVEDSPGDHRAFELTLRIERGGAAAFAGTTSTATMKRTFGDLADWLGRDNAFPQGVFLSTGTGLVPGDDFTLLPGDRVEIGCPEIGVLSNPVVQG